MFEWMGSQAVALLEIGNTRVCCTRLRLAVEGLVRVRKPQRAAAVLSCIQPFAARAASMDDSYALLVCVCV